MEWLYSNEMKIFINGNYYNSIRGFSSQHYYPHKLSDYAMAIYRYMNGDIPYLPIMAVDCHDCYACDFRCEDCLAEETKDWFMSNFHAFKDYLHDLEKYKTSLLKIANYSANVGESSVRFEMSGEGNPDLYPFRNDIVKFAHDLGMKPVYISSGSYLDNNLCETLVKYCSYIRISLPGITDSSYCKYSRQNRFLFTDAIKLLENLVKLRKRFGRENDLVLGVRTCLRPEISSAIESVVELLINIGIDTFQLVRAIRNESDETKISNIPISNEIKDILLTINKRKEISIPDNLDYYYNTRKMAKKLDGKVCLASEMTPILYSNYLLPCTHTQMIRRAATEGIDLSINDIILTRRLTSVCPSCCAIADNTIFNEIENVCKKAINEKSSLQFIMC